MSSKETAVVNQIMLSMSPFGVVCWKNVRGLFWTMDRKRKVRAGLCAPGSSDLIGFKRVKITPDMIGKELAVIFCCEVKTDTGRASREQIDFVEFIREQGGYAGIARSVDEAKGIIK